MIISMGSGSTVKGIRLEVLKGFDFPLAPVIEQNKISCILSTLDQKLEILKVKKDNFIDLKKGLMQQLLTGKIRVK